MKKWHLLIIVAFITLGAVGIFYAMNQTKAVIDDESNQSFFGKITDVRRKERGMLVVRLDDGKEYYISNANQYWQRFYEYEEVFLKKEKGINTIYFLKKDTIPGKFVIFFKTHYP